MIDVAPIVHCSKCGHIGEPDTKEVLESYDIGDRHVIEPAYLDSCDRCGSLDIDYFECENEEESDDEWEDEI